ncbi:hypothetical protein GWK47_025191 [Chionoecetes opilio]|uniref:Uncharacterized protein n=1 Tax=Chionoecetes opilio TaxID=41210 RepID=A0A8J4XLA2_CHIOP|nr:hypothetical protein GWK47_025191 [Chionoecetes opilio]
MKTCNPDEQKVAPEHVGQTGKVLMLGRFYYEGSRRRASHPPLERRPRPQRLSRRKGQALGALGDICTAPPSGMSSPTISVLSMASLGSSVAGGPPNLPLDADRGRRGRDGGGEEGGGIRRSSDGGGGGGDVPPRSSVYSSTSYAASRGFRPPSGGDHSLSHPVPPPRSRGIVIARGIKKSSSEVMAGKGAAPHRGILKSSSGILKSQHAEVLLSRSSSGSIAPRVNFSTTLVTSEAPPPPAATPPAPGKPAPDTHTTGSLLLYRSTCSNFSRFSSCFFSRSYCAGDNHVRSYNFSPDFNVACLTATLSPAQMAKGGTPGSTYTESYVSERVE